MPLRLLADLVIAQGIPRGVGEPNAVMLGRSAHAVWTRSDRIV
jgi:hypothetical protein